MNRRKFLRITGLNILVLGNLPIYGSSTFSSLIEPYQFNLDNPEFQKLLKKNSLPKTLRIKSIHKTPDRTDWGIGQGMNNVLETKFIHTVNRHNNNVDQYYQVEGVYTPVVLLKTANHNVFGQFFFNESQSFNYGVIRGFDERFYIVHPIFRRIFTYKFNCHGLPCGDFHEFTCSRCHEKYVRQYFQKSCTGEKVAFYGWHKCSKGGVHKGIPKITYLQPCGVKDDSIEIGLEF